MEFDSSGVNHFEDMDDYFDFVLDRLGSLFNDSQMALSWEYDIRDLKDFMKMYIAFCKLEFRNAEDQKETAEEVLSVILEKELHDRISKCLEREIKSIVKQIVQQKFSPQWDNTEVVLEKDGDITKRHMYFRKQN